MTIGSTVLTGRADAGGNGSGGGSRSAQAGGQGDGEVIVSNRRRVIGHSTFDGKNASAIAIAAFGSRQMSASI
jgi:hypothetical protein